MGIDARYLVALEDRVPKPPAKGQETRRRDENSGTRRGLVVEESRQKQPRSDRHLFGRLGEKQRR